MKEFTDQYGWALYAPENPGTGVAELRIDGRWYRMLVDETRMEIRIETPRGTHTCRMMPSDAEIQEMRRKQEDGQA